MRISNLLKQFISLIKYAPHQELIYQLKGAINIELGKYIYDNNWMDWVNKSDPTKPRLNIHCLDTGDGINVYIIDNRYVEIKKDKLIFRCKDKELFKIEDKLMISHYHADDLLWVILNFEKEIRLMKNRIKFYVENNFTK